MQFFIYFSKYYRPLGFWSTLIIIITHPVIHTTQPHLQHPGATSIWDGVFIPFYMRMTHCLCDCISSISSHGWSVGWLASLFILFIVFLNQLDIRFTSTARQCYLGFKMEPPQLRISSSSVSTKHVLLQQLGTDSEEKLLQEILWDLALMDLAKRYNTEQNLYFGYNVILPWDWILLKIDIRLEGSV